MSTIKRVVLCVALLNAAANGLRFGDRALDPREDVDAASSSKEDFASRLAVSAGKAVLLADADTTLQEAVEGSSEIGNLKTTSGTAKALDAEFSASGVADELHKTKGVSEDSFVPRQELGPKGPHVDGKKGVLKTTSGAAKAVDTEFSGLMNEGGVFGEGIDKAIFADQLGVEESSQSRRLAVGPHECQYIHISGSRRSYINGLYTKTSQSCPGAFAYSQSTYVDDSSRYLRLRRSGGANWWHVSPSQSCGDSSFWIRTTDHFDNWRLNDPASNNLAWETCNSNKKGNSWDDCWDRYIKVQCADCSPGQFFTTESLDGACYWCPAGEYSDGRGKTSCIGCGAGTISGFGADDCSTCAAGKYANRLFSATACLDCPAGKDSPAKSDSFSDCKNCPDGQISSKGQACINCLAGQESNPGYTSCVPCDAGYKSSAGSMCTQCAAGETSNSDNSACEKCAAGTYSSISSGVWATTDNAGGTCKPCGPGTFSSSGADKCEQCGDGGDAWDKAWENKWWNQDQYGLTSDDCTCRPGRTGTNCDQEECAPTTSVVSLGFLVLEMWWPRSVRKLSRNEDFSGISGALRAFDTNDDNSLSVTEARRAIRAGGMAVPFEVSHVWSRDGVEVNEGDITITEMIEDELARLESQGTKEYYERPSGSGEITEMEATYPNNHDGDKWDNDICAAHSTQPPKLTWTVDRDDRGEGRAFHHTVVKAAVGNACGDGHAAGRKVLAPSALAGTRCCGSTFDSFCGNSDSDTCWGGAAPGYVTYEEAKATCEGVGARLCTPDELSLRPPTSGGTSGGAYQTGCYFDQGYMWSNEVVPLDPVIYQQCAFFNGVALTGTDGIDNDASGGKSNVDDTDCRGSDGALVCSFDFQLPESYEVKSYQDGVDYEVLPISKHSYCVETKFCPSAPCDETTADPALTVTRCITGLQYDGTAMDVYARMLGTQGVALSWLDTSTVATGYRVYKVADVTVPFAEDTSARLLSEFQMRAPDCGLTHDYLEFRDITTGSEPGLYVGYAVVPLKPDGAEDKTKVGKRGFVVTWFGDIYVEVAAEGGGPVKDVLVKLSHVVDGQLDPSYTDFVEGLTDEYGEAHLEVRVQDPQWFGLTRHFRATVEKDSTKANGRQLVHIFEPSSKDLTVRHLERGTYEFTDMTSIVISGTVSHGGFGAAYFAENCPHTKGETGECMCPVDGAEVYIIRASGAEQEVTLNDGKFATAVFDGETVTIGLKMYNGTDGVVPHDFSVAHDAVNATVQHGTAPTFEYTANEDAELHFLDTSTQTLSATYVVGANRTAAEYVNGVPVVAKVERCGWEQPVWAVRGVATFELGAAAVEVRALGNDEVMEAKYYYPPGGSGDVEDCSTITERDDIIVPLSNPPEFTRGCRAEIPKVVECDPSTTVQTPGCQTKKRPCATMTYEYVDELPKTRIFGVDLSILGVGSNGTNEGGGTPTAAPTSSFPNCGVRIIRGNGAGGFYCEDDPSATTHAGKKIAFACCEANTCTRMYEDGQCYAGFINPVSNFVPKTWHEATDVCEDEGKVLCGVDEVISGVCIGKGCWYDEHYQWTGEECQDGDAGLPLDCTPGPTPMPPPEADATVEFVIVSPLCLESVSATAASGTTLQSLLTHDGAREYPLGPKEDLLMVPPPPEDDGSLYGKACTDDVDAVFREGDAVDFGFKLVEREPNCFDFGIYPWGLQNGLCSGYIDTQPSPDHTIDIRVADGVSRIQRSATYGDEPFTHSMTAGAPNPFAPFSHELSTEFTRPFDGAEILFVRHALVVGVIPEEVPQVWTVATNPTLIFFVLRDPPGGDSFTSLTEGSTISTSMAIDGSHAAELGDEWNLGASVGFADNIRTGIGFMAEIEKNGFSGGIKGGASYSQTPVDVAVSRSTSRHFDVGISFSTGISTSSSPFLPGQPSDIIVGGGANLRFISAIEIFATETPDSDPTELCLGGLTTQQFLPEQISTWVMSVYEIEKTLERLGAALTDPNTKLEAKPGVPDPRKDLVKQIENWQTVLSNYRAATVRDQAESVAEQLSQELDQFQVHFKKFLAEANEDEFKDFLVTGLNELEGSRAAALGAKIGKVAGLAGGPVGAAIGASVGAAIGGASQAAGSAQLKSYNSKTQGRVDRAAQKCVSAAKLADPSGDHRLCDVYSDISKKLELKESLFGICDFKDGIPSVEAFCKRDHYRSEDTESKVIGAFDALHDTTQFITFSGTTSLEFSWDIAESRGQELTSTHDANVADALGGEVGGGFNIGRRRLESADDGGVPGYAYPISGRVLAKSKKLLEVTPEALEERRRLKEKLDVAALNKAAESINGPGAASNPCRRRLEGLELSDDERRRLGGTICGEFDLSHSSSFAVSLGRAASKGAEHSRSVSIFLGDGNSQDVFAVKISQDAVYGTPIFTTMGGRSSCVGETGTTRRDSRVIIKEIKPLCNVEDSISTDCPSSLVCECEKLAPGKDAIFSVVLENLSPWVTAVRYLLRVANGETTGWDSGKYADEKVDATCPPGDIGSLTLEIIGSERYPLRYYDGLIFSLLPYGQSEVKMRVKRPDFDPQCFSYSDLELELVAVCEDTDFADIQDVYQYRTTMDEETGEVSVIHPKFVGRPAGAACAGGVTLDKDSTDVTDTTYKGDGKWCYSDLNLAVGCTDSPKACWETCSTEVEKIDGVEGPPSDIATSCPAPFIKAVEPGLVKCDVGALEAIDWEEETGQCRCQNSCECTVEDLYTYDVTKNAGEPGYETRETTTHLLTKDGLEFPPKNEDGESLTCGLYTFKDDTTARGPETFKADFDVSWAEEDAESCTLAAAAERLFQKPGCTYSIASNYDEDATFDDGSCDFPCAGERRRLQEVPLDDGRLCLESCDGSTICADVAKSSFCISGLSEAGDDAKVVCTSAIAIMFDVDESSAV